MDGQKTEEGLTGEVFLENEDVDITDVDASEHPDVDASEHPDVDASEHSDIDASERPVLNLEESTPYKCAFCCEAFRLTGELWTHLKTHPKGGPFRCVVCSMHFSSGVSLDAHLVIHSGEQDLTCSVCGKKISDDRLLGRHSKLHSGKPYACACCVKVFLNKRLLERHVKLHHGAKLHICAKCGKIYDTAISLGTHNELVHKGGTPHNCKVCGKGFFNALTCKQHEETHVNQNATVSCTVCGRIFRTKHGLRVHKNANPTIHDNSLVATVKEELGNNKINQSINQPSNAPLNSPHTDVKPTEPVQRPHRNVRPTAHPVKVSKKRHITHYSLERPIRPKLPHQDGFSLSSAFDDHQTKRFPHKPSNAVIAWQVDLQPYGCGIICKTQFLRESSLEDHTKNLHTLGKPLDRSDAAAQTVIFQEQDTPTLKNSLATLTSLQATPTQASPTLTSSQATPILRSFQATPLSSLQVTPMRSILQTTPLGSSQATPTLNSSQTTPTLGSLQSTSVLRSSQSTLLSSSQATPILISLQTAPLSSTQATLPASFHATSAFESGQTTPESSLRPLQARCYQCKVCCELFLRRSDFDEHIKKHVSDSSPAVCHVAELPEEKQSTSNPSPNNQTDVKEESDNDDKLFKCFICEICFATKDEVLNHLKVHDAKFDLGNQEFKDLKTEMKLENDAFVIARDEDVKEIGKICML